MPCCSTRKAIRALPRSLNTAARTCPGPSNNRPPGRKNNRLPQKIEKVPAEKIDLNRAGPRDLEKLPAIGPAMAKKIIDFRRESGDFQKIEDLMKVKGIGHKKFNRLREHVFVDH